MTEKIHSRPLTLGFLAACLVTASCSSWLPDIGVKQSDSKDNSHTTVITSVPSSNAIVVGDEPLAVKAGAGILADGGSAADAVAATYFALAVTYPVAAGLGGGGICMVRDPAQGRVESIDFLPRDVRSDGPFAVPGNVRGFALLHSLYGHKPWQSLVAQGERLANLGMPMSRALASRVAGSANIVRLDAGLAKVFMDESGNMHGEGDMLRDPDLGASLAAIRVGGSDALYKGALNKALVAYAKYQNGAIDADEFANYAPARRDARAVTVGGETVYLPAERTGAGKLAAAVLSSLAGTQGALSSADVANAVMQLLKIYGVQQIPNDLGATGFAAVDQNGQAVSCAVTMNGPFGSGRTVTGTGITLANAPGPSKAGLSVAFLTPVLASESENGPLTIAGVGAGGPNATTSILYGVAARMRHEELPADSEVANPENPHLSVNMIVCDGGQCHALPTPGAHGMGAVAGVQ